MPMDLGTALKKGLDAWRGNLNLCVPFILNILLIFFVGIIFLTIIFFIVLGPVMPQMLSNMSKMTTDATVLAGYGGPIINRLWQEIIPVSFLVAIFFMISALITSFFTAGAIGMAKNAIVGRRATLSGMFEDAGKNFTKVFKATLIIAAITLVGIAFIIPGILAYRGSLSGDINGILLSQPEERPYLLLGFISKAAPLIAGLVTWGLYALAVSIVFALVNFSVVIDGMGALEGVKNGIGLFMQNKIDVFLIWLFIFSISISLALISEMIFVIPIIGIVWMFIYYAMVILIIQPLTVTWWTAFYLSLKEKRRGQSQPQH
jgi:hypothetical protein